MDHRPRKGPLRQYPVASGRSRRRLTFGDSGVQVHIVPPIGVKPAAPLGPLTLIAGSRSHAAGARSYADLEVPLLRSVEELIDFVTEPV
jgi:hypothetical protein